MKSSNILIGLFLAMVCNSKIITIPLYSTKNYENYTFTEVEQAIDAFWQRKYYVELNIGTPAKKLPLILDTTSNVTSIILVVDRLNRS